VRSQTDFDARYTRKNNEKHDGYKNRVKANSDTKITTDDEVTNAAVHDSVPFLELVRDHAEKDENDEKYQQPIFADSAYKSKEIDEKLQQRDFDPQINEKGYRNNLLTDEQKANNKLKSKTRSRIEHLFGAQKMRMGKEILRTIGMIRAKFQIEMQNLVYTMSRLISLKRVSKAKCKE
jgi:IS5 family transposase